MKKVAVIYDSFPHYRNGIIRSLNKSTVFRYSFFGSVVSRNQTIKVFEFNDAFDFFDSKVYHLGPFYIQLKPLVELFRCRYDAYVFLGNPYALSYWVFAAANLFRKPKLYFWTHGWLSAKEHIAKRIFRNTFYRLADGLFLYGNHAKQIGISQGFAIDSLHVINNSLDFEVQEQVCQKNNHLSHEELCRQLGLDSGKKRIICTARLTAICRFDILFQAINILQSEKNEYFNIILIGDGPERVSLENLASKYNLDVLFLGASYDENTICQYHMASHITVSPGKVGLTAMHSMIYGTPVITHNDYDSQMPEFEAIVQNVTGAFFEVNSPDSLAQVIDMWFSNHATKPVDSCIERIKQFYTPEFQKSVIEAVLVKDIGYEK